MSAFEDLNDQLNACAQQYQDMIFPSLAPEIDRLSHRRAAIAQELANVLAHIADHQRDVYEVAGQWSLATLDINDARGAVATTVAGAGTAERDILEADAELTCAADEQNVLFNRLTTNSQESFELAISLAARFGVSTVTNEAEEDPATIGLAEGAKTTVKQQKNVVETIRKYIGRIGGDGDQDEPGI